MDIKARTGVHHAPSTSITIVDNFLLYLRNEMLNVSNASDTATKKHGHERRIIIGKLSRFLSHLCSMYLHTLYLYLQYIVHVSIVWPGWLGLL